MSYFHKLVVKDITSPNKTGEKKWKVHYYEQYQDILFEEKNLNEIQTLISFAENEPKEFKWPLNLPGFQFICGVFPNDCEIYIGTAIVYVVG